MNSWVIGAFMSVDHFPLSRIEKQAFSGTGLVLIIILCIGGSVEYELL
jgi:hypothetical protein